MVELQSESKKKKKVNKNKKKSWKKHVDIKDVEQYLDEKRKDERIGDTLAETDVNDLFVIDTRGKGAEGKKGLDHNRNFAPKFDEEGRRVPRRAAKQLRCHALLDGLPGAKDPLTKRNRVRDPEEKVSSIVQNKISTRLSRPDVKTRLKNNCEKMAERQKLRKKRVKAQSTAPNKFYGLWQMNVGDTELDRIPEKSTKEEYLEEGLLHERKVKRKEPVKLPKTYRQKPNKLPAVSLPHPGMSYNPTYEDHQDMLQEAVSQEENRDKRDKHWHKLTTEMFPTIDKAPTESTWLAEMSQGLPTATVEDESESDSEDIDEEEGDESVTVSTRVAPPAKTKKQRRKEKERLAAEKLRSSAKKLRVKESEVFMVKSYTKEIDEDENLKAVRRDYKIARKEAKDFKPGRLSRIRFQEEDVPVLLGDELPKTLRQLKSDFTVNEDRFKSLQRRGMIEPRIRHKFARKHKLKIKIKRSHKMNMKTGKIGEQ